MVKLRNLTEKTKSDYIISGDLTIKKSINEEK